MMTNGDSSMETYTLPCVKQITSGNFSMSQEAQTLLYDDLEGRDG